VEEAEAEAVDGSEKSKMWRLSFPSKELLKSSWNLFRIMQFMQGSMYFHADLLILNWSSQSIEVECKNAAASERFGLQLDMHECKSCSAITMQLVKLCLWFLSPLTPMAEKIIPALGSALDSDVKRYLLKSGEAEVRREPPLLSLKPDNPDPNPNPNGNDADNAAPAVAAVAAVVAAAADDDENDEEAMLSLLGK
jgi:hypothetical protein